MATPLALVVDSPADVQPFSPVHRRPPQLARGDIEGLAAALLDLGSTVEQALRTVMSMQRNLERVRRCDQLSPEGALLLQEMSRQVEALTNGQDAVGERLRTTARQISTLRPCE